MSTEATLTLPNHSLGAPWVRGLRTPLSNLVAKCVFNYNFPLRIPCPLHFRYQPPIEQSEGRDRKNRKRKKDDRYRSSPRDVGGQIEGDARDHGDRYSGGGAGSGSGTAGVSGGIAPGVIPGSHISVLPSFMDELKTRARMPVRTVVEPALAVYSVNGGEDVPGKDRGRSGTRGARGPGRRKPRVGVEPVYKFRL